MTKGNISAAKRANNGSGDRRPAAVIAREYLSRGVAVIPVPKGTKRPVLEEWQKLRLRENDLDSSFGSDTNIGVLNGEPSGGLVDVDLDAPEAVAVAAIFLPKTSLVFGRPSNRASHWEYRCQPPPRTKQYKEIDGRTSLVELRSTGSQTIWPGSTHPSGEMSDFDCDGEPALIAGDELRGAVSLLAACTLLIRHWLRASGSRHDLANALAGFLLRGGLEEAVVFKLVATAAREAGDEEWRARKATARATARSLAAGKKTTGGPTLAALIGEPVVAHLSEWLGFRVALVGDRSFRSFMSSPPYPAPLAPEALHGLAGDIVHAIEPHSEADPAALLVQLLVAFGSVIGRGGHFVAEGDLHYTNLFATLVGPTAKARKGSAWGQILRVLKSADPPWAADRVVSGLSSGEGVIWAVRDPVTKCEEQRDGTFKEVELDPGVTDKRLLVFEAEFASTLRVMERDGNTLSPIIRQAWDTGDLRTLTKNSPTKATGAHIALIAHITRDEVRRCLSRTEAGNGFANRFLWVCARRSKALPDGGRLHEVDFNALIKRLNAAISFARSARELRRGTRARVRWHAVYEQLSEGKPGLFGTVIARAEAQVMRLGCIYSLLDCSSVIRREHLLAALALWEYCEASARYIFGDALGDPIADGILRALHDAEDGLTRTAIRDLFARNRSATDLSRALDGLLERGLARFVTEDTGGHPAERWFAASGSTTETTNTTDVQVEGAPPSQSYLNVAKTAREAS